MGKRRQCLVKVGKDDVVEEDEICNESRKGMLQRSSGENDGKEQKEKCSKCKGLVKLKMMSKKVK